MRSGSYMKTIVCMVLAFIFTVTAGAQKLHSNDTSDIIAYAKKAVVFIRHRDASGQQFTGTGFFVDDKGTVVTCAHVIDPATEGDRIVKDKVWVSMYDGDVYEAEVLDMDDEYDVAVLHIDVEGSPYLKTSSSDMRAGDDIIVIGFPLGDLLGEEPSVSRGSISAVRFSGIAYQLDASINHGNSGGPVINMNGEVIGVLSFKLQEVEGMCFAISSKVFESIIAGESVGGEDAADPDEERAGELIGFIETGDLEKAKTIVESYPSIVNKKNEYGFLPLGDAAYFMELEIAEFLIEQGADVNGVGVAGQTALHYAAENGDVDMMRLLLSNGADAYIKDDSGETPIHTAARDNYQDFIDKYLALKNPLLSNVGLTRLHIAAMRGDAAAAEDAIENGGDVDAEDSAKWTPLHWAAVRGNLDVISVLVKNRANLNPRDGKGKTPLMLAAYKGSEKAVDLLLINNAAIEITDEYKMTALQSAVNGENIPVIKRMIKGGANVNTRTDEGWTPLHHASFIFKRDIVEMLLSSGADVNAKNELGKTPLQIAVPGIIFSFIADDEDGEAYVNQIEGVKILIAHGSSVNTVDNEGDTPLHDAVTGRSSQAVEILLKSGADVNARNNLGETPLFNVSNVKSAKLLVDAGADVFARDKMGGTVLYSLIGWGYGEDIYYYILSLGVDVNAKTKEGNTVLHEACMGDLAPGYAKFLLDNGADVDVRNNDEQAPLHLAALNGEDEIVKILLSRGADVNARDKYGNTALDLAESNEHPDVVDILRQKGGTGSSPSFGLTLIEKNAWTEFDKDGSGDKSAFSDAILVLKVKNSRTTIVKSVKVSVDWYDDADKMVGHAEETIRSLKPGEERFVRLESPNIPTPDAYISYVEEVKD